MTETLGPKIRKQRRRLGLTLDDLAGQTRISKPYLSLIENDRVPNPPSDEKLRRLELTLGFTTGELVSHAHLARTPRDVRAVLVKLMERGRDEKIGKRDEETKRQRDGVSESIETGAKNPPTVSPRLSISSPLGNSNSPLNLDDAYMSGVLQEMVERHAGNVERLSTHAVPVINKVAAGYPSDFTDLSYPPRVADDYVTCPDVRDADAFAARVHGDSMTPKYRQGDIVIFSPAATPKSGDDCFVRFESGETTFKRVFFENDASNHPVIRLQPRNEKYPPRVIPSQEITGLYKAVFKYQSVEGD